MAGLRSARILKRGSENMEISAVAPIVGNAGYSSRVQHDVVTTVSKAGDGTHKVNQDHYITTIYDRNGSLSTVQKSYSVNFLV